ncbi:MAG: thioredoxin peroxidase [Candidatus Cloacimonadota bacterium]|nr:MAG: thioredoxin peroxidase [Candidatus Cloacimonadota bacterium]
MLQAQQDLNRFEEKKIKVIAVCPENPKAVKKFAEKHSLSFDLVSDKKHEIADKYGQQVIFFKLGRMPAQIICNKKGKAVFKHYAKNMKDIVSNDEILSKF